MRLPWVKWYPADWSSEPGLRLCCAATRGIWAEALNIMMLSGSDRVQGSVSDLTRVCACEPSEMVVAVAQLSLHKVADVFQQNVNTLYVHNVNTVLEQTANIILVSRRRRREFEIRHLRSLAGKASATKRQLAFEQTAQHRSVYASVLNKKRGKNEEEVKEYCTSVGLSTSDGEWLWDKLEGSGWKNNGRPIGDWKATVRSWKKILIFPSQKSQNGQNKFREKPKEPAPIGQAYRAYDPDKWALEEREEHEKRKRAKESMG